MTSNRSPVDACPETLLEVVDLQVSYGGTRALKGISFVVRKGETVALVGANGAGKTTTMRALTGLVRPREGVVRFGGRDLIGLPPYVIARTGLRMVPEGRQVFGNLTVFDNLRLGAYARYGRDGRRRVEASIEHVLDRFPRLRERARQLAGNLSGGEQQMLAIGRALVGEPTMLLLDEPSSGLAPLIVDQVFETLRDLQAGGATTIMLVEQLVRKALGIAQRAYVLERGQIVLEGPSEALSANPRLEAAYLGGHHGLTDTRPDSAAPRLAQLGG